MSKREHMDKTVQHMDKTVRIGDRELRQGAPCFVIAEVGSNHNGDYVRAIEMIDAAAAT